MRHPAILAVAALFIPGTAVAGTPYVGVDLGTLTGRSNDIDEFVSYSATQTPATPLAPAPPAGSEYDDTFSTRYNKGYDFGLIGGYDFGIIRLELEVAHKRVGLKGVAPDDISDDFLTDINTALNRPSVSPDPGAPGQGPLTIDNFDLDGSVRSLSAMANAMVDIDVFKKFSVFGGGGYGRSRVSALGDHDSAWAMQYILGARYAITDRMQLGLKYRYYSSGIVTLQQDAGTYAGNPNRIGTVDQTVTASVMPELQGAFRTRSILASLTYNFR